jgi:hypothetical protein
MYHKLLMFRCLPLFCLALSGPILHAQEPASGGPIVSLSVADAEAAETVSGQARNVGAFVINRSGNTEVAITVLLSITGTATPGDDYDALPTRIVMAAGRTRVEVPVRPVDDSEDEDQETVVLHILASPCGEHPEAHADCYQRGDHVEGVVRIADNDEPAPPMELPVITIRTVRGEVSEGETTGVGTPARMSFLVERHENTALQTVVVFHWSGSATRNQDYTGAPEQVVFPAGQSERVIHLTPVQDALVEGDERVEVTLVPADCFFPISADSTCYRVGTPGHASGVIHDDDHEPENRSPVVHWRSPPAGASFLLPEELRLSASAVDLDGAIRRVTFFANEVALATVTNDAPELTQFNGELQSHLYAWIWHQPAAGEYHLQAEAEDDEGAVTRTPPVTVFIRTETNRPQTVVVLSATDREAAEPATEAGEVNTGAFRVRREGPLDIPLVVHYLIEGSADNGADYHELSGEVRFSAGQSSAEIRIVPLADHLTEERESVRLSLVEVSCPAIVPQPSECYRLGNPSADQVVIVDAHPPENRPPVTQVVNPWQGQVFRAGDDIRLAAEAWDSDGSVEHVAFFAGEHSLGIGMPSEIFTNDLTHAEGEVPSRLSHPRYHLLWTNVPAGRYVLRSVATDDDGAHAASPRIEIKVIEMEHPSVVTLEATDALASESPMSNGEPDVAEFLVHRTGATNVPLRVYLQLGGSARPGQDYHAPEFSGVLIRAGARTARLRLVPIDDEHSEGPETIEVGIVPPRWLSSEDGGSLLPIQYLVGEPARARARLLDNDVPSTNQTPRVRIVRPEAHATFAAPAHIGLSAEAFDLDGTVVGVSFFANGVHVGERSGLSENRTNTTYSLVWENVPSGVYELRADATDDRGAVGHSAPVRIEVTGPQRLPKVEVFAVDPRAREPGSGAESNAARFRFRRTGEPAEALTVTYGISGSADNGVDYQSLSGQVVIPAGRLSQVVAVVPLADNVVENPETVVLSVVADDDSEYTAGRRHEAAAYIIDAHRLPTEHGGGLPGGEVMIVLSTSHEGLVSVQVSKNLVDWTHVTTLLATEGKVRFVDPEARSIGRRFYQVVPAEIQLEDLDD